MRASITDLIQWTFPNFATNYQDAPWLAGRCILGPKNLVVDAINIKCADCLPTTPWVCESADAIVDAIGLPPHKLLIKRGMPIMLLRNLNPYLGLCNGTRLIALNVHQGRVLEAQIIGGQFDGNIVFIPRIALQPKDGDFPFEWRRRQFPVRICFAMTINKAQGQTLQRAGIYLADDVFAHGQLSICRSFTCLAPRQHTLRIASFSTKNLHKKHSVQRSNTLGASRLMSTMLPEMNIPHKT